MILCLYVFTTVGWIGIGSRMQNELVKIISESGNNNNNNKPLEVKVNAPPNRGMACWLGGSIVTASSSNYLKMAVSKEVRTYIYFYMDEVLDSI